MTVDFKCLWITTLSSNQFHMYLRISHQHSCLWICKQTNWFDVMIILFWLHFLLTNVPVNTPRDILLSYCFSEDLGTLLCTHLKYHKVALDFLCKLYKQLIKGEAREEGTGTVKRKWMIEDEQKKRLKDWVLFWSELHYEF